MHLVSPDDGLAYETLRRGDLQTLHRGLMDQLLRPSFVKDLQPFNASYYPFMGHD